MRCSLRSFSFSTGQGANMAIADAATLAHLLRAHRDQPIEVSLPELEEVLREQNDVDF